MKIQELLAGDADNYAIGVETNARKTHDLVLYDHENPHAPVVAGTSLTPDKAEHVAAALIEWASVERKRRRL